MVLTRLFVYGTLRKYGSANHFLQNAYLLKYNLKLLGFSLYHCGAYPIAIESQEDKNTIIGDIYEVEENNLDTLDAYEGEEYFRKQIPQINCQIYLARDRSLAKKLPLVPHGDWLLYVRNGNR